MALIGLTGGIGAGKSAVAALLADRGAAVLDADAIARQVLAAGTPGLRLVAAEFGAAVVGPGGELDRSALAAAVFGDPRRRQRLDRIVHPLIRERTRQLLHQLPAGQLVVHDVPLLVENDMAGDYDLVVVVWAPLEVRLARLRDSRGMSEAEAMARIRAQASDAERAAVADVVLTNDADLAALARAVDRLWQQRLVPLLR